MIIEKPTTTTSTTTTTTTTIRTEKPIPSSKSAVVIEASTMKIDDHTGKGFTSQFNRHCIAKL